MRNTKGSVLIETIFALTILLIVIQLVFSVADYKGNALDYYNDDYLGVQNLWENDLRCKIYCAKQDPILDITF